MAENPLKVFERIDPELLKILENTRAFALADGALPKKFKLLIAMSLDAAHGSVDGVRALAQQAMGAGASKEEVTEALRVASFVGGAGSAYTGGRALQELF
jgi:alkylhydroperoxidase/carboxymuconolactone decarboxylase family protein YurZ